MSVAMRGPKPRVPAPAKPLAQPPAKPSRSLSGVMAAAKDFDTSSAQKVEQRPGAGEQLPRKRKNAAGKPKASSRENKRGLVLYLEPETGKALRLLALENDLSVQQVGLIALSLAFRRFGRGLPADLPVVDELPAPPTVRSDAEPPAGRVAYVAGGQTCRSPKQ